MRSPGLSGEHGRISHAREPTVTDKQQGWNDALNIVFDQFNYVAWQKGRSQERQIAAEGMEKLAKHKCRGKSEDYQHTAAMHDVVTPFCEMLKGDQIPAGTTFQHRASRSGETGQERCTGDCSRYIQGFRSAEGPTAGVDVQRDR